MRMVAVLLFAGCRLREPAPQVGVMVPNPAPAAAPEPAEVAPTESPRRALTFDEQTGAPVVTVDHWMWCFAASEHIDMCASTRELCLKWSNDLRGVGCVPAKEAACFHTRGAGDPRDSGWCYRTVDVCRKSMLVWRERGGDPVTIGCTILRYGGQ